MSAPGDSSPRLAPRPTRTVHDGLQMARARRDRPVVDRQSIVPSITLGLAVAAFTLLPAIAPVSFALSPVAFVLGQRERVRARRRDEAFDELARTGLMLSCIPLGAAAIGVFMAVLFAVVHMIEP